MIQRQQKMSDLSQIHAMLSSSDNLSGGAEEKRLANRAAGLRIRFEVPPCSRVPAVRSGPQFVKKFLKSRLDPSKC